MELLLIGLLVGYILGRLYGRHDIGADIEVFKTRVTAAERQAAGGEHGRTKAND